MVKSARLTSCRLEIDFMGSVWSAAVASRKRANSAEAWIRSGTPMSCGIDFCIQVRNVLRPQDEKSFGKGNTWNDRVGFKQFIAGTVTALRYDKSTFKPVSEHKVDLAFTAGGKTSDRSVLLPGTSLVEDPPRPSRLSTVKTWIVLPTTFYGAWPIMPANIDDAASGYFDKTKNEYKFYDAPGYGNAFVNQEDPNDKTAIIAGCKFDIEISHYLARGDDTTIGLWKGRCHIYGHRFGPSARVPGMPDEEVNFDWLEDVLLDGTWSRAR